MLNFARFVADPCVVRRRTTASRPSSVDTTAQRMQRCGWIARPQDLCELTSPRMRTHFVASLCRGYATGASGNCTSSSALCRSSDGALRLCSAYCCAAELVRRRLIRIDSQLTLQVPAAVPAGAPDVPAAGGDLPAALHPARILQYAHCALRRNARQPPLMRL